MTTYEVRTFGCQMNKHDSERVSGLLRTMGYAPVAAEGQPDIVVFLTCCVRENADERLRGQVASLKALKDIAPGTLIAVGGCIGQRDGEVLLRQLPHVDVVFGTHNLGRLPDLLERARVEEGPVIEVLDSGTDFTSDLPGEREHPWHAWVPITVGCDNFCTYCIVPYVRGRERSRPMEDILSQVHTLVADGVREITLLGQNVNSYGRDLYGKPEFPHILREAAATGIDRIRFATSHPKDLSPETIQAMAQLPNVCNSLHLPVQSGSDRILKAMNRGYTAGSYLELVSDLYEAIPGLALSTDIIVGFPGESEEDFEATMDVVRQARFAQAFTFIYSPRKGTPAADLAGAVPRERTQERFDRLVELVKAGALASSQPLLGTVQKVLVEGPSKRDVRVLSGRTETNKVVHAPIPQGLRISQLQGRFADILIEETQTWFLAGTVQGYEPV